MNVGVAVWNSIEHVFELFSVWSGLGHRPLPFISVGNNVTVTWRWIFDLLKSAEDVFGFNAHFDRKFELRGVHCIHWPSTRKLCGVVRHLTQGKGKPDKQVCTHSRPLPRNFCGVGQGLGVFSGLKHQGRGSLTFMNKSTDFWQGHNVA